MKIFNENIDNFKTIEEPNTFLDPTTYIAVQDDAKSQKDIEKMEKEKGKGEEFTGAPKQEGPKKVEVPSALKEKVLAFEDLVKDTHKIFTGTPSVSDIVEHLLESHKDFENIKENPGECGKLYDRVKNVLHKGKLPVDEYLSEDFDDEHLVACEWCGDEYEPDELTKTDIGWLCETCIEEIRSRGENITLYKGVSYDTDSETSFLQDKGKNESLKIVESKHIFPTKKLRLDEAEIKIPKDQMMDPKNINLRGIAKAADDKEAAEKARQEAEAKKAELRKKHADTLTKIQNSSNPIQTAFEELVPNSGAAETKAGELVRAMMKLLYRDYNDGDVFYEGYGIETCAAPAAFIMDKLGNEHKFEKCANMSLEGNSYTKFLDDISDEVIEFITQNPELLEEENTEDMYSADISMIEEWIPSYDTQISMPANLEAHLEKGNISARDLQWELESWGIFDGAAIDIEYNYIYVSEISRDQLDEIERDAFDYLEQYGDDLTSEYGDPYEDDDEIEEALETQDITNKAKQLANALGIDYQEN